MTHRHPPICPMCTDVVCSLCCHDSPLALGVLRPIPGGEGRWRFECAECTDRKNEDYMPVLELLDFPLDVLIELSERPNFDAAQFVQSVARIVPRCHHDRDGDPMTDDEWRRFETWRPDTDAD